jgi:hypothetical protein
MITFRSGRAHRAPYTLNTAPAAIAFEVSFGRFAGPLARLGANLSNALADPLIDGPVKRGDQLRTPCYRPNAAVSRWTTPARAALDARYQMSMLTQRVRRWLTWRVEGAEDFPGASDVERAGLEPATNETSVLSR